jgi:hypothetical protein
MKIFIHSLLILAAAIIGLVAGFALKKPARTMDSAIGVRKSDRAGTASSEVRRARSPFNAKYRISVRADDSPLATKLERDLSMSSSVTRWLYWLEALERATAADYPRLAQLAQGNPSLVRLVGTRWAEMNPQHMFEALLSRRGGNLPIDELQRVLFEEWPKKNIDAVIAALSKFTGPGLPASWRRNFATSLVVKDPELGLRLMSEWNVENSPTMTGVKKWAAANPRHAAEFALAYPSGRPAMRTVMDTIGKEWARSDPAGALQFASAQRGEFGSALASAILKEWTDRDLNQAAGWLAKADAAAKNRLSPAFVEGWAKSDAPAALKWCEANLTGTTFENAAAALLRGAAAIDLAGAAELVNSMPPSRARGEAATVVMQKWLPDYLSDKPPPPEAIAWFASLDSQSIRRALEQVQWQWSEADPKSFAAFVDSLSPEQVPPQAYSALVRNMARKNPLDALDWANRLPEERRINIGADAFDVWQQSRPEAARDWLNKLPPNDPRHQPFFQNLVAAMAFDPRCAERLASLSATERALAEKLLPTLRISEERRTALLNALKSSSK